MRPEKLDELLGSLPGDGDHLPPMSDQLRRELDDLRPVSTRHPRRRIALAVVAAGLWVGGLLSLVGTRPDLAALPRPWLISYVGAWAASFVILAWGTQVPRRGHMMPRSGLFGRLGVAAGLGFIAVGLAAARSVPELSFTYEPTPGNILAHSYYCVVVGTIVASMPIVLLGLMLRGTSPSGTGWLGMAAGAAGGSLGGLLLHMHCPISNATHLGFVHGGVVLLAGGLGALVVPRLARRRG